MASVFVLGAGALALAPPRTAWVIGAVIALLGATRSLAVWWQGGRLRRSADEQLIAGVMPESSPLLGWRASELVADSNRRVLARSLAAIAAASQALLLSSALNRRGVRPHLDLVRALAKRVGALERPVAARGMALVEQLICDGFGPLYARDKADQLGAALERCLIALEPATAARRTDSTDAPLPAQTENTNDPNLGLTQRNEQKGMTAMKSIVLAYDASPAAEHALERTAELANAFAATVTVASIARPLAATGGRGMGPIDPVDPPSLHREEAAAAKNRLEALGVNTETVVGFGEPGDMIARVANERHADLVVVGGSQGGQLRHLFTRSVSAQVSRRADCDVLVVR